MPLVSVERPERGLVFQCSQLSLLLYREVGWDPLIFLLRALLHLSLYVCSIPVRLSQIQCSYTGDLTAFGCLLSVRCHTMGHLFFCQSPVVIKYTALHCCNSFIVDFHAKYVVAIPIRDAHHIIINVHTVRDIDTGYRNIAPLICGP